MVQRPTDEQANRYRSEVVEWPEIVLHVDWSAAGAVRTTILGRATGACADVVVRRLDAMLVAGTRLVLFKDHWYTTSYDPSYLSRIAGWIEDHRSAVDRVHVVSKSILAGMVYSASSTRYGGLLQRHETRTEFDRAATALGIDAPVDVELAAIVCGAP